jgi:hypothetical protein
MTEQGWREAALKAQTDPVLFDLMVKLLHQQDQAKQALRAKGYGWTGLDWPGTIDLIPDNS